MAYNEYTADRIRHILSLKKIEFTEKRMFGGLCFMVDNKMCIGVIKEDIMARVGPEVEQEALLKAGARPMDFTGRPMKGFVFISEDGFDLDDDLAWWIDLCLEYNPLAKASKKKKSHHSL